MFSSHLYRVYNNAVMTIDIIVKLSLFYYYYYIFHYNLFTSIIIIIIWDFFHPICIIFILLLQCQRIIIVFRIPRRETGRRIRRLIKSKCHWSTVTTDRIPRNMKCWPKVRFPVSYPEAAAKRQRTRPPPVLGDRRCRLGACRPEFPGLGLCLRRPYKETVAARAQLWF